MTLVSKAMLIDTLQSKRDNNTIANALREVSLTPLSPIDIAVILRQLDFPINEIAIALHKHFSTLDSLDIGQMLLEPKVYPTTTRKELVAALGEAGFETQEAELAANILYPVTMYVFADQPWQNSNMTVHTSQTTTITYLSGTWSFNPQYSDCKAEGNSAHIAQEDYALPNKPVGALVGRIGETVFLIGREANVPSGLSGELQLCINDDLKGRYGAGLTDNKGKLEVKISTRK
ncbi:hypothetical protein [Photorhabdus namnaonensis]|uniref:Uncharacterized protein n=1 Tax=Photorhabdus namnaonensis TaxID=1851568 RepID=A0A1B8YHB9_9GAMM|nr:hypothetical protein [Photorhabdus namnaonensis]OCA54485.1 hypothetical protein Phpb_02396 [Photorhabdus namnaonensis]